MTNTVVLETTMGDIEIELDAEKAPITVDNFLKYVKDGFYDGLCFHRVIKGFMVQGGGFKPDGAHKQGRAPIKIESRNGLKNKVGTIAMARTSDPNSATCQFFINTVNNANLDYPSFDGHGYTVFGKVVSGLEAIKDIEKISTSVKLTPYGPMQDWPKESVEIKRAYIKE